MSEKRRLNADVYGLISTSRDGFQSVANLVRGTEITIGTPGFLSTLVQTPDREYRIDHPTLKRLRERSVKID
jgi:hypothetical protein